MDKELQPFQNLKIQLDEIISAPGNFDETNEIGGGGFGKVYKGELSHSKGRNVAAIKRLDHRQDQDQGDVEFLKEIRALSRYEHENLISLLGFCYQGDEKILVYQLASRGSLEDHLSSPDLTWSKRIKICLDVAKGLRHLHDPKGTHQRLIHCDVKSGNILLDDQWNAKVADFGFSTMGPANELHSTVVNLAAGTPGYCDPQYAKTNTLTKESDVYSFGVVLVEVICGTLCYTYSNRSLQYNLVPKWIQSYEKKLLNNIIFKDSAIEQMDRRALKIFSDITYQCLKESREDRPKMAKVVTELEAALRHQEEFSHQFQHFKIQLEEIVSATNNFDDNNCIGAGSFGKVYKGEVSHYKGRSIAAIKRIEFSYGQGEGESDFFEEMMTLSEYRHANLISILGYCYQGAEMILVYELASRGSLEGHLNSPDLTWSKRIKICLDTAKGLRYLHDPRGTHQRLIHCDIKCSNILLDDHYNAKIADFLLTVGLANKLNSTVASFAEGTLGYRNPQYRMTHIITKASDVYSFGVVLFEVLFGRLCYTHSHGHIPQILLPIWKECYENNRIDDIIFKLPTIQPLDKSVLKLFADIAYRCLKVSCEDRPTMAEVVTELENALECQNFSDWEPLFDYEKITKTAEPPLNYKSKVELRKLLSKGVLLNGGKTWLSLNRKAEHCETICIAECLDSVPREAKSNSRFFVGNYRSENGIFKTRVKAQFLSPGITYTVNLVFKMYLKKGRKRRDLISLKYRLQGETKTSTSYLAVEREDGWWMAELYQLTSDQGIVDIEILFDGFDQYSYASIEAEGIEFRPLEKVEDKDENQALSYSYAEWEEKLPTDYEELMKWSKNSVQRTTKKEAYLILRKGFLINDGQECFSLDKNGKKCHMLSARAACIEGRMYTHLLSLPESRFEEALEFSLRKVVTLSTIKPHLVSPKTTYASYLVYKLPKDQSGFEAPVKVKDLGSDHIGYIYLASPQTPVIRTKAEQNTYNPRSMPKIKGLPQQRNDGWMEVQIWEFQTANTTIETNHMHLKLSGCGANIPDRLIIQGVEFRPV